MTADSKTGSAFDYASVVRDPVKRTPPYQPAPPPAERPVRLIKLDMNESPYGPSPKTRQALADFTETNRYPDFAQANLCQAFGNYLGWPGDQIICGAGLDDVLVTLINTIVQTGDEVIISEPTFGVYREFISLAGGVTINAPLAPGFQMDADTVLAAVSPRTKLIIICTPNNPTGNAFPVDVVETIVANAGCLVAIDEAYAEFNGSSYIRLMDRHPNVVILRTMSKFACLAGMRVGYGAFPAGLMPYVGVTAPAFHNVSMISRAAAMASLDDLPYLQGVVARIVADREQLAVQLRELPGVEPIPSSTNFLLVKLPVEDAGPVVKELASRGVLVRHFGRPELGLKPYLRVTIGNTDENEIFLAELADILSQGEPS